MPTEPIHCIDLQDIKQMLIDYDIQYPDIVLAQIRLETGNLSSYLCKENKNLFGMKQPRKRETTSIGEHKGFAVYDSYASCIKDYALWQNSRYQGGDYYSFIQDIGYAEDPEYITKLQYIVGSSTIT
jgi:flagellum-specific peptidoglycan hydrolase FlgJ